MWSSIDFKPKRGALALDSQGRLGLILSNYKELTYDEYYHVVLAWTGIHLMPEGMAGKPWSSRDPMVVADSIEDWVNIYEREKNFTLKSTLTFLRDKIHEMNVEKGFWEEGMERSVGQAIALMHSELSEALEAAREGNPPSEKAEGYSSLEEEFADVIIRVLDYCGGNKLDIAGALLKKLEYNKTRPFNHNKEF